MTGTAPNWHMRIENLLGLAVEREASDLHLKVGQPPILRIDGQIAMTDLASLAAAELAELAHHMMDDAARRAFQETGTVDFAYVTEAGERFRVNVFRQRGLVSVAARRVVRRIRTFAELHLPADIFDRVCDARQGLVVFSGATGSGKSTSIAACIDAINCRRRCHIVTLEDPIEFVFEDKMAFINQREIGTDVPSYDVALKTLFREDPDVVLVGEMRDRQTVATVLRAAETTRLVFTTVHAATAPGVVTRILDLFEADERPLVRESLAANLVAIICQKLLASADPNVGRVPATEILLPTPAVRKMIREGDEANLATVIGADVGSGMRDFTQDLARLVRQEWVDPRVAYEAAPNPDALKMAIRGIDVKKGTIR